MWFSAFKELIGDLNELKIKDYGDEQRGAIRLVNFQNAYLTNDVEKEQFIVLRYFLQKYKKGHM